MLRTLKMPLVHGSTLSSMKTQPVSRCVSASTAIVLIFISYLSYQLHCCTLPDKCCLSHGMLPLSGHDDVALFE